VNPGNWRAFVRTKLKNLKSGKVVENRFRAGESIDQVRVERKTCQFLYREGADFVVMDTETYDQFNIAPEVIGTGEKYLKENMNLDIMFDGSVIIAVEIPLFVNLEVTMTEPGMKGDTVSNTLKPATLETGAIVYVPLFVNQGDMLKIDTRDGSYVERVK
jgi:elongation factor P